MSEHSGSTGVRRRDFLKVLGAGTATAATVGCSSDRVEKLIPYLVHPDNTVPGVSNWYATVCRECAIGCGVTAEVRDGRPIKLEGNPQHPINRGALCAQGQAALQGLYNPDRIKAPLIRQGTELVPTTWDAAIARFRQMLDQVRTQGQSRNTVFINRHETGLFPTFLDRWLAAFDMPPHLAYDPIANISVIEANRRSFGVAWPGLNFTAAKLVVSFDADFLEHWGVGIQQQMDYADARANLRQAPRMVYIGPRRTLTGLNADVWISCRPGTELIIAQALLPGSGVTMERAAELSGASLEKLRALALELGSATPSMILSGPLTPNAFEVALTVNQLNQALGNVGVTILPDRPVYTVERLASAAELAAVAARMRDGGVPLAMVRGVNPTYNLPHSLGFQDAFMRVPLRVSFSSFPDETTMLCDLVLPDHHALESWGMAQATPGVVALQQPTMDPVFLTRPTPDVLLEVARTVPAAAQTLPYPDFRAYVIAQFPGGPVAFSEALASGGVVEGSIPVADRPAAVSGVAVPPPPAATAAEGEFYLLVHPSPNLGDGSGANKPWLQELPDPVTKLAWQSWVEIHPLAAERLGVDNGDVLRVTTPYGSVDAPAYLYIGIQPETVAVQMGQGHDAYSERYAEGVGVNAMRLLPPAFDVQSGMLATVSTRCRVEKTDRFHPLVTTEGSPRQHGRGIARAMLVSELRGPGEVGAGEMAPGTPRSESPPQEGLEGIETSEIPGAEPDRYRPGLRAPLAADAQGTLVSPDAKDKGMYDRDHWSHMASRRWAMIIDLARCTGCQACVTACYAENNLPTVGAPYQGVAFSGAGTYPGANIVRGREMTWIRIERYYEGGEDGGEDWEARFVPMLCQHCGNAPCEPVCPVYATYHSPDGLNVQVYNRCVGTRYCSNNCPYKVRYFNWFGYGEPDRPQYSWPEPLNWQLNPDVNVRTKGVMEKCTFCVQRIREAENRAKVEGRPVAPDEFTTACAQACPSRAITFGDAADPNWSIFRLLEDERAYHVFEELGTYTAVVYLKKVNYPAPAAPTEA